MLLLIFFAGILLFVPQSVCAADPDTNIIVGDWQRTDGNYRIRVSNVKSDGQTKAAYFNPRPIHIAQAETSIQKSLIKLFITFQDKEYEGSTYKLYYYAQKDALVGFYYQAAIDQTFEVIFLRKTP